MQVRLSSYRKDKYILVHWFMELQNDNEKLSFMDKKREKEEEKLKAKLISFIPFVNNSFMIVRFDISNTKLYFNEYETFKYKYTEEELYMGSAQKLHQYVREYFNDTKINDMLRLIIASDKTRLADKEELARFLIKNDKHNDIDKKEVVKETNIRKATEYYRYDLTEQENKALIEQLNSAIAQLEYIGDELSFKKEITLKNILNNVKHIEVSEKKTNATLKARNINKENSIRKIQKAYEKLKQDKSKVTIYSVSKQAKVSYTTAKKYSDIYKKDLV